MGTRPTKTRDELRAIIMAELRRSPEFDDVQDVSITRPVGFSWGAAFVRRGAEWTPPSAFIVVLDLQTKFDLADE